MDKRGYFGIGCLGMKTHDNYGTLLRSAQLMGAKFIYLIGTRFTEPPEDTMKSWRHIPLYQHETFDCFLKSMPYESKLIGIEMTDKSLSLPEYSHPERACYLLGSEDFGLPEIVIDQCDDLISIPGKLTGSLNVSTAGSIALYDRIVKRGLPC